MATKKKNVKNDTENLVVSEKSITFAPKFITHFSYKPVFESVDDKKNPNLVAHEALSIREILVRSSRGQRLNLHERMRAEGIPDDMYPENELPKVNETLHDAPPDGINDIVDVHVYAEKVKARKEALERKKKENASRKTSQPPVEKNEKEGPQEQNADKHSEEK